MQNFRTIEAWEWGETSLMLQLNEKRVITTIIKNMLGIILWVEIINNS